MPKSDKARKFFPVGLLFLIATLSFIFATVQVTDSLNEKKSIKYYFNAGLDKIEFHLYVMFLRKHMRNEVYYRALENITKGQLSKTELYWMQHLDPFFQSCLNTEICVSPNSLAYSKWREKRREYLQIVNSSIFQKYGFKSAEPLVRSTLASLFLQESLLHLIINVFFLFLVGAVVESKIGILGILGTYFACGIIKLSTYSWIAPFSLLPISGSDGGVAGIIGVMLACSGTKKIRIYYSFRNVSFISVSSLFIFVFWMLCQLILLHFTEFDRVEFISEGASLLYGLLLGFLLNRLTVEKRTNNLSDDLSLRISGVKDIYHLNYTEARKTLYALLDEYPTSKEILFQLFNIVKFNPASEEYHEVVRKILSLKDSSKEGVAMINLVFKNYIHRAQPTIRFDVQTFFDLLHTFSKAGYDEDAVKILKVLIKHDSNRHFSEILAREQLQLARHYFLKNDIDRGNKLLGWLIETFPNTESAKQARTIR